MSTPENNNNDETPKGLIRQMLSSSGLLVIFAIAASLLLALTWQQTAPLIEANEKAIVTESLNEIITADEHDNALLDSAIEINSAELGHQQPMTAYRAYNNENPVAVLLPVVAPDGYNGAINLLVGIYADGTLAGVRVVRHRETPGLGDKIELRRSDWITRFAGKSLGDPKQQGWAVKKDGGEFDAFTGATITPRAVVKAVHRALLYFKANQQNLFGVVTADNPSTPDPS